MEQTAAIPSESRPVVTNAARLHARTFKKTLFIILDAGTAIRNILRTDVFRVLKEQPWLRTVIFSPITDAEFREEFEAQNVVVEPIQFWRPNPLVKTLRSLRKD